MKKWMKIIVVIVGGVAVFQFVVGTLLLNKLRTYNLNRFEKEVVAYDQKAEKHSFDSFESVSQALYDIYRLYDSATETFQDIGVYTVKDVSGIDDKLQSRTHRMLSKMREIAKDRENLHGFSIPKISKILFHYRMYKLRFLVRGRSEKKLVHSLWELGRLSGNLYEVNPAFTWPDLVKGNTGVPDEEALLFQMK